MAWAFVTAAANGSGSQNTLAKSVTAGNLLVFIRFMQTGTDSPTISDGVNSWTQVTSSPFQDTTNGAGIAIWWAVAATTASITVTVSSSTNTGFAGNSLLEYSGNAASSLGDGTGGTANISPPSTGTNATHNGAVVTAADGDLIVSAILDDGASPTSTQFTAGTSPNAFTKRATGSQDPGGASAASFAVQDFVQTAHASIDPTWTIAQADVCVAFAAAFKVASGTDTLFAQAAM